MYGDKITTKKGLYEVSLTIQRVHKRSLKKETANSKTHLMSVTLLQTHTHSLKIKNILNRF